MRNERKYLLLAVVYIAHYELSIISTIKRISNNSNLSKLAFEENFIKSCN